MTTRAVAFSATLVLAACNAQVPVGPSPARPSSSVADSSPPLASAVSPSPTPALPIGWQPAAPMVYPRSVFNAIVLTDGTPLAVGDDDCEGTYGPLAGSERSEIYDPSADRWIEVGSLNKPRSRFVLIPLPAGAAMVLGGSNQDEESFSSTKLYSPEERTWSPGPQMLDIPVQGAAALPDGRVVAVAGGDTQILDIGASAWRPVEASPELSIERLVALADGRILAIGEIPLIGTDLVIFDPEREAWSQFPTPSSVPPWFDLIALSDGSTFHIGSDEGGSRVERYDPTVDRWSDAAPMREGRVRPQMTQLADGRVLVAGGMSIEARPVEGGTGVFEVAGLDSTEIYDPASDSWAPGPRLNASRQAGFAAVLSDGSVLVYGGMVPSVMSDGEFETGQPGACPAPVAETERLYVVP